MDRRLEKYREIVPTPWNGNLIYSENYDKFFHDFDEVVDYYEELKGERKSHDITEIAETLLLYQTKPVYLEAIDLNRQIEIDEMSEEFSGVYELIPDSVKEKLDELNKFIDEQKIVLYYTQSNDTVSIILPKCEP